VPKALLAAVGVLHHQLTTAQLDPARLVTGAGEVLHEDATVKIAGQAEPYSHVDLVDIAANVEGAEAVLEMIRPRLARADLPLVEAVELGFVEAYAALSPTGNAARQPQTREPAAGARFIGYTDLAPEDREAIQGSLRRLTKLFAKAGELI